MGYYRADCKNVQRGSARKETSAGKGTLGVSASTYLDTNAQDVVGIELWLRDYKGEPLLQVSALGNGYNVSRHGEMLFDGSIEEFVGLLKRRTA